jgi:3-hydroxyisobutyrate dehydrogenase-like beta-hydroxyacid dehydrogenase
MTISPKKSKEFAGLVSEREGVWVEAPVLGNQFVAEDGKLQVCVGGTREQFDMLVPVLSSFGTPRYIGEVGKATTMKLGKKKFKNLNFGSFLLGQTEEHGREEGRRRIIGGSMGGKSM